MSTSSNRIAYIDVIRGLAIIGSMTQHIGVWIFDSTFGYRYSDHWVFWGINGIAGLSGPLFVSLAGLSAILMTQRHPDKDAVFVKRGLAIIAFGYLLSFMAPNWFNMGAWFVLHMIGFGILTTPVVRRCSTPVLMIVAVAILAVSCVARHYLETRIPMGWSRMNSNEGGIDVLRLVFFEGHFSIFPWLSFYIGGFVTYRLLSQQDYRQLFTIVGVMWAIALAMIAMILLELDFTRSGPTRVVFQWYLGFYPVTPLFYFAIFPLFILVVMIFEQIGNRVDIKPSNPLICLGQTSLTLYFIHIVIGQWLKGEGLLPAFSPAVIGLPLVGIIIVATIISMIWHRFDYKFTPEWLLRKIPV